MTPHTSRLVLLLISIISFSILSPNRCDAEPAATPFGPIAFLVGGTWRGELPGGETAHDKTSIELRCGWLANHQGVRFDSSFIVKDKRAPYTSGTYFWNAEKRQLVFSYSDADANLIEGAVFVENKTLRHEFTVTDGQGKISKARAVITPVSADEYTNDIFVEESGTWKKMAGVTYHRASL